MNGTIYLAKFLVTRYKISGTPAWIFTKIDIISIHYSIPCNENELENNINQTSKVEHHTPSDQQTMKKTKTLNA